MHVITCTADRRALQSAAAVDAGKAIFENVKAAIGKDDSMTVDIIVSGGGVPSEAGKCVKSVFRL